MLMNFDWPEVTYATTYILFAFKRTVNYPLQENIDDDDDNNILTYVTILLIIFNICLMVVVCEFPEFMKNYR